MDHEHELSDTESVDSRDEILDTESVGSDLSENDIFEIDIDIPIPGIPIAETIEDDGALIPLALRV